MFTIEQIKAAHSKVKTGADYPKYVQELIGLGVMDYVTFVADGNAIYHGQSGYKIESGPKYQSLLVAEKSNSEQFISNLKIHQQGQTDFTTFCRHSAEAGIEKWIVDLHKMTCSYYDKADNEILIEKIPAA